jgi:hypothetical protein
MVVLGEADHMDLARILVDQGVGIQKVLDYIHTEK